MQSLIEEHSVNKDEPLPSQPTPPQHIWEIICDLFKDDSLSLTRNLAPAEIKGIAKLKRKTLDIQALDPTE